MGEQTDIGISVALVPTHLPGITIGRRHLPALQAFQNGPNEGADVFVPIDALIGGVEKAGQGWQMLMAALAAGRGISLPSLSARSEEHTSELQSPMRISFAVFYLEKKVTQ